MDCLQGFADDEVEPYIRACSLQLQLANIAEERERIRRRREYDASGEEQRESLAETAELLDRAGVNAAEALRALHVELVLTAHPTEATRRARCSTTRRDLMDLLDRLDDPRIGRRAPARARGGPGDRSPIWWQTDEVRRARPRVDDEVRRNLFVFESTLFDAVPEVLGRGRAGVRHAGRGARGRVRVVGGLGHGRPPEVGAETLARTLRLHRRTAVRLLRDACARWRGATRTPDGAWSLTPALEASLARDERELPSAPVLRRTHRRVGAAAGQARLRRAPAREHPRAPGREPGYADPRSCGATSRSCARASAPSTSRAARSGGCCGRSTCSASTSQRSTCASRRASCARRRRAAARLRGRRGRGARIACSRRRSSGSARACSAARTGAWRASSCACSTRSRWRATPTAAARCRRW